jgi:sulfur carrier protein
MRIEVNGQPRNVPPGTSLTVLAAELGLDVRRIAMAVNGAVIPRTDWPARFPAEGDRIEIIEAVGGG